MDSSFEKLMDVKFDGLHDKLDTYMANQEKINCRHDKSIEELSKNDRLQDKMLWLAIGGLAVIQIAINVIW